MQRDTGVELVLATGNKHKLKEFQAFLSGAAIRIVSLEAYPGCPAAVEDGETFVDNALKKARTVAAYTGRMAMADDSGLEVDCLGGAPGVWSARYAGPGSTDEDNNRRLLRELAGVPDAGRQAQFRCVIAVVDPAGAELTVAGGCRGRIVHAPRGTRGFGYDPLFLDETSGMTFGEMNSDQKNAVSHRARAVRALEKELPRFLESLNRRAE
jgi:XTP/dITP diphosphohydrolase